MPYRKKSTYPRRRRFLRRRRFARKGQRTTKSLIYRSPTVIPDKMIVKLPYVATGLLDTQNGLSALHSFNLNSLYDPDRTGTGHQPLGYDEWKEFYNQYRVFKVAYEVVVYAGQENASPVICGWLATPNVAPAITNNSWYEQPHCRKFQVGNGTGLNKAKIKGMIYLPRINGQSSIQYKASENTCALYNQSPSDVITGTLGISPLITNDNYNMAYYIRLVYYCELFDRFPLLISEASPSMLG